MENRQDPKTIIKIKKQLRAIFAEIPDDKKKFAEKFIDMATFSIIAIEDLQQIIQDEGLIVKYQNGANQHGTKENPAVKMRVSEVTNLLKIIDSLSNMNVGAVAMDELNAFLKEIKK